MNKFVYATGIAVLIALLSLVIAKGDTHLEEPVEIPPVEIVQPRPGPDLEDLPPVEIYQKPDRSPVIGLVTAYSLNVRTGPSNDYPAFEWLENGDVVVVVDRWEDWYHIQLEDGDGWVHGKYLEVNKEISAVTEANDEDVQIGEETQSVLRDGACYRDSKSYELIGYVVEGNEVTLTGNSSGERIEIYSPRHSQYCWTTETIFKERAPITDYAIERVMRWTVLVQRWMPDFTDTLTEPLVLAVMAKESKGEMNAVDVTGLGDSVGVMQVIPRQWVPGSYCIGEPRCNIYAGMWYLDTVIHKAREVRLEENPDGPSEFIPEDTRLGLALYNCGLAVLEDNCRFWGGYVYADMVLDELLPIFQEQYESGNYPK